MLLSSIGVDFFDIYLPRHIGEFIMTIGELKNIAQTNCDFNNLSFKDINKIEIVRPNPDFCGKVDPFYINNSLLFDFLFDQDVINNLQSTDIKIKNKAISIVMHELYHYKEITITANNINYHGLIFDNNYSKTYTMVLSLGYKQWSEYYAYYNSAKYYQRNIIFDNVIRQSWATLQSIHDMLCKNNVIQMPFQLYLNIKNFISNAVMFAAQYSYCLNSEYLESIQRYQNDVYYSKHYEYIIALIEYMSNLYNSYPNWVSESKFIQIGKYLLNILQCYNITYLTNDLSDNFKFIKSN